MKEPAVSVSFLFLLGFILAALLGGTVACVYLVSYFIGFGTFVSLGSLALLIILSVYCLLIPPSA